MLVIALHTAYLAAVLGGRLGDSWLSARQLMLLALAAYASYTVNAAQFLLKFRAARLAGSGAGVAGSGVAAAAAGALE
jgi:3-vinyl bacteriochlorophyllide hydratase